MLEFSDIEAGYGRIQILNGVNLSMAEGQTLGILGHNGMGKTTLLRTLMGFIPAKTGTIHFRSDDITTLPTHLRAARGIAYVPQGRQIFPQLSVMDNLRMGALGRKGAEVGQVLAQIPRLTRLLDRAGGALSGGEQQLLAIARALCGRPELLLLDEPTEGIQPSIVDEIGELLLTLNHQFGLAIVVIEQNLEFVAALASRVAIIQKGVIVRNVNGTDLRDDSFMQEFVGLASSS